MAGADYYSCDVCGAKCFYDARLNWDFDSDMPGRGSEMPALDYCGDIRALCIECSKSHRVVIERITRRRRAKEGGRR